MLKDILFFVSISCFRRKEARATSQGKFFVIEDTQVRFPEWNY
jgi:hypothetical protein